jgi:hypothetical protein
MVPYELRGAIMRLSRGGSDQSEQWVLRVADGIRAVNRKLAWSTQSGQKRSS